MYKHAILSLDRQHANDFQGENTTYLKATELKWARMKSNIPISKKVEILMILIFCRKFKTIIFFITKCKAM